MPRSFQHVPSQGLKVPSVPPRVTHGSPSGGSCGVTPSLARLGCIPGTSMCPGDGVRSPAQVALGGTWRWQQDKRRPAVPGHRGLGGSSQQCCLMLGLAGVAPSHLLLSYVGSVQLTPLQDPSRAPRFPCPHAAGQKQQCWELGTRCPACAMGAHQHPGAEDYVPAPGLSAACAPHGTTAGTGLVFPELGNHR